MIKIRKAKSRVDTCFLRISLALSEGCSALRQFGLLVLHKLLHLGKLISLRP